MMGLEYYDWYEWYFYQQQHAEESIPSDITLEEVLDQLED